MKAWSNSTSRSSERVSWCSSSVSPQNPLMKSLLMATPVVIVLKGSQRKTALYTTEGVGELLSLNQQTRNNLLHAGCQVQVRLSGVVPSHTRQDSGAAALRRHVDAFADIGSTGNQVQKLRKKSSSVLSDLKEGEMACSEHTRKKVNHTLEHARRPLVVP